MKNTIYLKVNGKIVEAYEETFDGIIGYRGVTLIESIGNSLSINTFYPSDTVELLSLETDSNLIKITTGKYKDKYVHFSECCSINNEVYFCNNNFYDYVKLFYDKYKNDNDMMKQNINELVNLLIELQKEIK